MAQAIDLDNFFSIHSHENVLLIHHFGVELAHLIAQ